MSTEAPRSHLWTVLPLAAAGLAGYLGYRIWGAHPEDISPAVAAISALGFGAAIVTGILGRRDAVGMRMAVMLSLLAGETTVVGMRAVGFWPFQWDGFGDSRYAAFIALVGAVTTIGVARSTLWARWVAMAFAVAAMGCGSLNAVWAFSGRDEWAWMPIVSVLSGATLWLGLAHPAIRQRFGRGAKEGLWSSTDSLVRIVRVAAIGNILAVPMLLVYGASQPLTPETQLSAFLLAPVLALGSALVIARKVAGVLVLGVGGLLLGAQTFATLHVCSAAAGTVNVAGYYAAFWIPAGLLGVAAAVATVWRARHVATG